VLTAKPAAEEPERLEHRLLSSVPVEQSFSVAESAELAHREIDELLDEGRAPIVVGGAGLYLRAALTDLDLKPAAPAGLREEIERELATLGPKRLHARLRAETARTVHPEDRKRIVRALELERMGERPHTASEQLWSSELRAPTALFGITLDRGQLERRIEARAADMLELGAVDEVERALERGASATARKAIGFAEIEALIEGAATREEARARIARRQRRYAKRQLTWMRKLPGVELLDRTGVGAREAAASMLQRLPATPEST
jgi:tRNA dimethylallyltransferase